MPITEAFDFDKIVPRRGSGSYKWESMVSEHTIPMWVADMDFPTAPAIVEALHDRVSHGIFGYSKVPDAYFQSVIDWFSRKHEFHFNREWILYTTGVVPAISAILRALTSSGDRVLVQTPVYNCFFSSIRNLGCQTAENRLRIDTSGRYTIDFEDLEAKAADPGCRMMLLCNPHNPVGRVWSRDELLQIGEICLKHGVIVVSDEIHCELVLDPTKKHCPFASIHEDFFKHSITCLSPSKSFNLAGLQVANLVVHDSSLRERIDKAINIHEICDINPFGIVATIAAYGQSEAWLEALRAYLWENYQTLKSWASNYPEKIRLTPLEATYLAWLDCRATGLSSDAFTELLEKHGVLPNSGKLY